MLIQRFKDSKTGIIFYFWKIYKMTSFPFKSVSCVSWDFSTHEKSSSFIKEPNQTKGATQELKVCAGNWIKWSFFQSLTKWVWYWSLDFYDFGWFLDQKLQITKIAQSFSGIFSISSSLKLRKQLKIEKTAKSWKNI